jgi:uncharacterized protein YoxC
MESPRRPPPRTDPRVMKIIMVALVVIALALIALVILVIIGLFYLLELIQSLEPPTVALLLSSNMATFTTVDRLTARR